MIRLAEIFQSGMVLQRGREIRIWGSCEGEQSLKVYLNDIFMGKIDSEQMKQGPVGRRFAFTIPPQEAMEDGKLRILGTSGKELVLQHVDIGEVWIAGGQSNMEFLLQYDREGEQTAAQASDPHLRYFEVGKYAFEGEKEEGLKDGSYWDRWLSFTPKEAPWFCAAGAYFALQLRRRLRVPVGIIGCSWGGTSASAWLDERLLRRDPLLRIYTDAYDKAVRKQDADRYRIKNFNMRFRANNEARAARSETMMKEESVKAPGLLTKAGSRIFSLLTVTGPHDEHRPGGLYRCMLQKITGYSCQGVIWYQGESDDVYADRYDRLFTAMIQCWRKDWQEELPFLFVQLAPFEAWGGCSGKAYPLLRQQQQKVEDEVARTWMASIMDVGSRYDIHPKEKRQVGERLAGLALNKVYGFPGNSQSPRLMNAERKGKEIRLQFQYAPDGLEARGEVAALFRIVQAQKLLDCTVRIEGDHVVLESEMLREEEPVEVSFAYCPYCRMTLYHRNGLPARPFAPIQL